MCVCCIFSRFRTIKYPIKRSGNFYLCRTGSFSCSRGNWSNFLFRFRIFCFFNTLFYINHNYIPSKWLNKEFTQPFCSTRPPELIKKSRILLLLWFTKILELELKIHLPLPRFNHYEIYGNGFRLNTIFSKLSCRCLTCIRIIKLILYLEIRNRCMFCSVIVNNFLLILKRMTVWYLND